MKNINNLKEELASALTLIEKSELLDISSTAPKQISIGSQLEQTDSLLDRCAAVIEKEKTHVKPKLRIIHHFACSGGTLISKCISAMPNVFLLSEVHPHTELQRNTEKPQYSPSDISRLALYAKVPNQTELAEDIFVDSIKKTYAHVSNQGGTLVLRDHTHSDYCVDDCSMKSTIYELLKSKFDICSLVTLRNPIDSYLSLVANGWVHFSPSGFDEYCTRLNTFLSSFESDNILLYEDFVAEPRKVGKQVCSILHLTYNDNFEHIYDVFPVTGDSGRKGSNIHLRKRRVLSDEILRQIEESTSFNSLQQRFNFR